MSKSLVPPTFILLKASELPSKKVGEKRALKLPSNDATVSLMAYGCHMRTRSLGGAASALLMRGPLRGTAIPATAAAPLSRARRDRCRARANLCAELPFRLVLMTLPPLFWFALLPKVQHNCYDLQ